MSLLAVGGRSGATPRGQPWTSAVMLPHGCNGLSVRRLAVLWTFRAPALCRPVHRELMRSGLLDLTSIIPVNACYQRNYVERYSRFITSPGLQHYLYNTTPFCYASSHASMGPSSWIPTRTCWPLARSPITPTWRSSIRTTSKAVGPRRLLRPHGLVERCTKRPAGGLFTLHSWIRGRPVARLKYMSRV